MLFRIQIEILEHQNSSIPEKLFGCFSSNFSQFCKLVCFFLQGNIAYRDYLFIDLERILESLDDYIKVFLLSED